MTNRFFQNCKTEEQVKETFTRLAKQFHPDNGGDAEMFKAMMNEYKEAFARCKGKHTTKDGEEYTKETKYTAEEYADIIDKIIHFENVTIEIIGSWIWVSGNTFNYREALKNLDFFFSKSKKAWYNNGDEKRSHRRGHSSLNELRDRWGTEEVATEAAEKRGDSTAQER